jgi:hypothetical protein
MVFYLAEVKYRIAVRFVVSLELSRSSIENIEENITLT